MPTRRLSPTAPPLRGRRPGIFHRESTRLRSNVADQVQRDLLPAGRMLSVFLILCELLAEIGVLIWSRGQSCDRPLRFWVYILIVLQTGTILLNCLKIWQGRDTFGQHRNGLSATEFDMYAGASTPRDHSSASPSMPPTPPVTSMNDTNSNIDNSVPPFLAPVVVDISSTSYNPNAIHSRQQSIQNSSNSHQHSFEELDTQPLLYSQHDDTLSTLYDSSSNTNAYGRELSSSSNQITSQPLTNQTADLDIQRHQGDPHHPLENSESSNTSNAPTSNTFVSFEFVDKYMRIVNAWYLVWFILGSYWVSDGGTCSTTAPHLYRLIVALTIIYYALLFLPLACFCLIVCCLPLFILVYRIMLPYAERERRRARAADPDQVQRLHSIVYSPETFAAHTGNQNPDDAICVICLCEYENEEIVRFLPCKHHFHKDCVDVWLRLDKACCLCKQDIDSQQTSSEQRMSSIPSQQQPPPLPPQNAPDPSSNEVNETSSNTSSSSATTPLSEV